MSDEIVVTHATKVIHGRVVLDDVTLTLPRGGILRRRASRAA